MVHQGLLDEVEIVDVETMKDIYEPGVTGGLWVNGPDTINEYYNNPEASKLTYAENGWLKTGDLFYRDENFNYYFVDRNKLLLKYKNYQISPVEVEGVIIQHPEVMDAVVVGIPDQASGELPVAYVIRRPGSDVTAQEIKDVVKINDANLHFMNELSSRVVAQSGRLGDRFHLGKLILQSLKDAPDFVLQIDGATGETWTFEQCLEKSVRCAIALRNLGLRTGDVMVFMSPNYSEVAAAMYAALYLGVNIAPVDMSLDVLELKSTFEFMKPKIIFSTNKKGVHATEALEAVQGKALIVTFDHGDRFMTYPDFIKNYSDNSSIEDFKPIDFDAEETVAVLVSTSGTTGLPKAAAVSHKNYAISLPYMWSRFTTFPRPTRLALVCTTLQWMTAQMNYLSSPFLRYTRLHSSLPLTVEHAYHLINTYKPTFTIMSPTLLINLINPATGHKCDFTSFEVIYTGGSAVHQELFDEAQKVMPEAEICCCYGMSELSGCGFQPRFPSQGSCGTPMGSLQYRIVDVETQKEILEPNVQGELWVKGPVVVKKYYNNPEATKSAFTEDNWLKTGDLFYRDENWNHYFVDRFKLLLKYKNYQISPVEVEAVIMQHPGIQDVVVVGIPDEESGELPVAFIIRRAGSHVTAQEIKDMVKNLLSDAKQLRGGVIFIDSFPITATSKVHRMKLKEMALTMNRE